MPYDLSPTHFDGVALQASAPFDFTHFDAANGPMQSDAADAVNASIVGVGDRFVRNQPKGAVWELHVFLSALEETDRATLLKTFSREKGLVFLRADDGTGTPINWRIESSVLGVDRIGASEYLVRLNVPDTRWKENAENTTGATYTNKSGNSIAVNGIVNKGDRKARPIIEIDADTAKSYDPAYDFGSSERGWYVNRAPFPLDNYAIDLTFFDGADNPYNLTTFARSTSVTNQINQVGGINATVTTIPIDTPVGGGLVGPGLAVIDAGGGTEEQIYFAANSGTQLTGVIRGIGGTVGSTHADNTVIRKSEILLDASDLRVFVDGEGGAGSDRWIGGTLAGGATRIWINASAPAATVLTLKGAITASVPAAGGTMQFNEELPPDLKEEGLFAVDREIFFYSAVDFDNRRLTGIERAIWCSSAAAHADAAKAYFGVHLTVVAFGRYGLGPAPEPIERRPCIQLPTSRNTILRWGDAADDAQTVFYDPARPNRSMQWRPVFEVPEADLNSALALRLNTSTTKVLWRDSDPAAGKLQCGRLSFFLPPGMMVVSPGMEYDFLPRKSMRLRVLGRDAAGFETELADHYDLAETAVFSQDINPVAIMHEVTLNAVRAAITGQENSDVEQVIVANTNYVAFKIILTEPTLISSLRLKLRKDVSGTYGTFRVWLTKDVNSVATTVIVAQFTHWSGGAETNGTFAGSSLATTMTEYEFRNAVLGNLYLPAGTYYAHININSTGFSVGMYIAETKNPNTQHTGTAVNAGGEFGGGGWFRLNHPRGGAVQEESALLNTNVEASFDNVIIYPDANTPQYPLVDRNGGLESLFHCNARVTNTTNGKYFDIDAWLELNKTLTIDTEKRTATYVDGSWTLQMPGAIRPGDRGDWLPLEAGSNDLTWAEQGMANHDLTIRHRSVRA